jgi:hypothetical protein
MPATKVQLTGGAFQDSEGNKLALGYLLMKLAQDGNISGVGNIASGIEIRIQLDSNGSVVASPAQSVWGVDQMLPPNNYYRVTGYTAAGQPAWGPNNQQVVGSGGTFDVGTWVPNQVISWVPPLQALELDTNGTLNPNQGRLNFEDTATVTWSVDGSGNLEATASSGAVLDTEVNSTPITDQTVLNFEDTATVKWSNPSGGVVKATAVPTAIDALVNNRVWKAIPNSGSLGQNIGFQPQLTASGNGLISATATQTNFNTISTSASASNEASVCFSGMTGSGLNPNVLQIWSTQTLKACKWQSALVDTADVRVWMALCDLYSGNTANLVSDTPNLSIIGFRYSTAAGDTTWHAVCGVGGTCTVVDTGIAIDTLGHSFGISVSPTSISFTIDGVAVATITTNIPANTTKFGDVVSVDNIGLTNVKTVAYAAFSTAE